MKFFILIVFCFGVRANVHRPIENKCGEGFDNEEVVTDENNIIRPCRTYDFDCMRNFMAENSNCKPAYSYVQDPLYLKQTTLYFAYANLTFTYTNYTASGLNKASIVAFFYNKFTKKLVIGIKIPALTIDIPKIVLTFRKPGQESIMKSDFAFVTFKSLIFTASIPKIGKFLLDKADIKHGYSGEAYPVFFIGPAAYTSKDPIVTSEYKAFLANVPLGVNDVFLFYPRLLASLYIQKTICDFGLDLYSI